MEIILGLVFIVGTVVAAKIVARQNRRRKLLNKYGDENVVDMIMRQMMWQGMTTNQLIDSLGRPVAIDRKVFKTKVAETYKYVQTGRNQFAQRVMVENGQVVGWTQR